MPPARSNNHLETDRHILPGRCVLVGDAYGGDMDRRRVVLGVGPAVAFVAVTYGIRPAVNFVARMKSPHSYSEYQFAGTWVAGLLAAAVTFGIGYVMGRRSP